MQLREVSCFFMEENLKKLIVEINKFVLVGLMNTGIDFGVLNLLMWATGIDKGRWLILLNMISFGTAVVNSYFWNKFWTFKAKDSSRVSWEFSQFLIVSIIGLIINTSIVYLLATFTSPMFGLSQRIWTNLAKVTATALSLVWNFLGYKFIVFKSR